jgi:ammonia channel protein AmtB
MPTVPLTLFALFQLMFAIITPGLVVGAVAERGFTPYVSFVLLFSTLFYAPLVIGAGIPMECWRTGALDLPVVRWFIFQLVAQRWQRHCIKTRKAISNI